MNFAAATDGSTSSFVLTVDLTVKVTALLLIGLIIERVLARWRASLGSAAGNACLIGLLWVPFSAVFLPTVNIACLPADTIEPRPPARSSDALDPGATSHFDPGADVPLDRPTHDSSTIKTVNVGSYASTNVTSHASPIPADSMPTRRTNWLTIGLIAYTFVLVALLVRSIASLIAVARLRGSSAPVDVPAWLHSLDRCRRRLAIRQGVSLAYSTRVSVPLVLGWIRPMVVLPESFLNWGPGGHADAVLLHELAHVRRGDYPWNMLLRFVQALYWPHPLIWLLGRAMAETRERACDDLCVFELGGPPAYREALLAVAGGLSRRFGPPLGLAMARPSRLARRLARIEGSRGDARCLPSLPARLAIALMAAALAVTLGTMRLTRAEARPVATVATEQTAGVAKPAAPRDGAGRVFRLNVAAADTARPIPRADVRVWMAFRSEWRKTDAEGRLEIIHSTGPSDRHFSIDVWGDGRAMQRHQWSYDPNKSVPDDATISLQPGESLGGIVQDEQGRPIGGATLFLWSHNFKRKDSHELLYDLRAVTGPDGRWRTTGAPETTGELLGFRVVHPDYLSTRDYSNKEIIPKIADLRADKAVTVMKKGVPIEGRVIDAEGKPVAGALVISASDQQDLPPIVDPFAVITDAAGHFRTGQVKAGEWFLVARAKGHAPGDQRIKVETAVPQVQITLGRSRPFTGRVVDRDGKPIVEAFVNVDAWRGYHCLGVFLFTDRDGRFRWDDASDDDILVNVTQPGYFYLLRRPARPSNEDVIFTLSPCLSIRGTVYDADTRKRVEKATIDLGAVDPKTGDVLQWKSTLRSRPSIWILLGSLNADISGPAEAYKIRIQSPGYQTFVSRTFRREEKVVVGYDVALVPSKPNGPVATVLGPDGKPLARARVYHSVRGETLILRDGVVIPERAESRVTFTSPDGTFEIPQHDERFMVLILGDNAYAIATKKTLGESPLVRAMPYGRIDGRYFVGSRPAGNLPLELSGSMQGEPVMWCRFSYSQSVTTGPLGGFSFEHVIPMPHLRVRRHHQPATQDWVSSIGETVHVGHGETAHVKIGGMGRAVVGRVEPPVGWNKPVDFTDNSEASVETNRPFHPIPLELLRGKRTYQDTGWSNWSQAWRVTPEGLAYENSRVGISVGLALDGSFRIDDLLPGDYRLVVNVNKQDQSREHGPFTRAMREFTVPPIPGGRSDELLDLGVVRLEARSVLEAGDPAPPFAVTTVDGKALSLKDYQGKYILLDFGVMWNDQSRLQVFRLNDVHHRFRGDDRFAILSLVLGPDNAATRAFVSEKGEAWPQAIVGSLSNPLATAYGIEDWNVPSATLIGPDGKVIAQFLQNAQMTEAIAKALGQAGK